jgi:hypothetical protein
VSAPDVEAELARCLVTPGQLAHLQWLLDQSEHDDPQVAAMAAEVLRGYTDQLLATAPRRP